MTANKPMTAEQLDELMTVAVNMQRDSEANQDRPSALFAYAVQVAVMELRKVRDDAAALAAENAALKDLTVNHARAVELWNSWADAEDKISHVPETPATDAYLAEVRACGVEMMREHPAIQLCSLTHVCDEFAAQLRQGGAA
ncbi:hypothetical protein NA876_17705 [Escherichia coli]|nr:hypothetical protein [Escherichia coli]